MRWFPLMVLLVVAAAGCSNSAEERAHRYDEVLLSNTKTLERVQAEAKKLPQSAPLRQLLTDAEQCLSKARNWKSDSDFREDNRCFNSRVEEINKLLAAGNRALALRPMLPVLKSLAAQNARAAWHVDQAIADLDAWEKSGAFPASVKNADDSLEFARSVLEGNEGLSKNSTVSMRDLLYFEGDVETHDGDSELVKAHLRQAFRANLEARAAQAAGHWRCEYVNELAELTMKHVYNLRRGLPEAAVSDHEWTRRDVKPAVDLLDRLIKIKQQIASDCPPNSAAAAELKKAEALMADLPRKLGEDRDGNLAVVKAVIDRAEDELLRYKKNCGK